MNQLQTGRFIAQLRKEKQMTQTELGEKLGVTNKTVSRWENGNYMPDIGLLQPLCEILGITVNELISGKHMPEEEFRQSADNNLVESLQKNRAIRRDMKLSDCLGGAGTGILVSMLYSVLFSFSGQSDI